MSVIHIHNTASLSSFRLMLQFEERYGDNTDEAASQTEGGNREQWKVENKEMEKD